MKNIPLEQKILRICPSKTCNNTRQTYVLIGIDGCVIWRKKAIYECLKCGYLYKFKLKMRDTRGRY